MVSHLPTDIVSEFQIDGAYVSTYAGVDLSARVRGNDSIRITRGQADQQAATSPMNAAFTLNTADGLFADGNPLSPLWGKVGVNTRMRTGVKTGGTWEEYVRFPDYADPSGDYVTTADKASLDVTGDIDVRAEITPFYTRGIRMIVAAKWNTSANRSWIFIYDGAGRIELWTSPDGTLPSAVSCASGLVLVDENSTRSAVRATLDVNDGAGNRVYRFYTAETIAGPWTEISSGTFAGTTSIFASTAAMTIGSGDNGNRIFSNAWLMRGKIHALEVRNGIGGTLVADFKPAGKGIGTTSWADTCASPNTWTLTGDDIRVASDRIRASGQIRSLPQDWDVTGRDVWVPCTMAGLLAQYNSTKAPIGSAIYRNTRNYPSLTGYWPMEDASGADQAASAVTDAAAGLISDCSFGSATGLDGSAGAVTLNSQSSKIILRPHYTSSASAVSVLFYFKLENLPASDKVLFTLLSNSGTASRWTIAVSNIGFAFTGYNQHGTVIDSGSALFGSAASPVNGWIGMAFTMKQEGANVRWENTWHQVGSNTFYTTTPGGVTFAGYLRQFQQIIVDPSTDSAFVGAQVAHVVTASVELEINTSRFRDASKGYSGETAGDRMLRLAQEEGVTLDWLGDLGETAAVGPQLPGTLYDIFTSAAKVDAGLLVDTRDILGFTFITGKYLGNRRGLVLDYSASHLTTSPKPTGDDRYLVNDFTANRPSGSAARYEATDDRRKNVRDPDDPDSPGVGRYERSDSFSTETDGQLPGIAQRTVSFGTWDAPRVTTLAVDPHRTEINSDVTLFESVRALDVGDPITLTGLGSAPMAPDDLLMVAFGYTETISNMLWSMVFNTVPAGPYQVGVFGGLYTNDEIRLDASSASEVHAGTAGVAGSATSVRIRTPKKTADNLTEPCWIDTAGYSAEFPVDIKIAGERMTLTAATAASTNAELTAGTFEAAGDLTAWSVNASCTLALSATFAHAGSTSGRLTVTGSPTQAYIRPGLAYCPRVESGQSVTLSAWVRSAVNLTDVRATIDWLDSSGNYLSSSDSGAAGLLSASGWVQRTVTATAPAGAAYAQYGTTMLSSPAAGTLLYTDDVTITNADVNYQTLTVTRGVNTGGTGKTLADGDKPYLFFPTHLGMGAF